MNFTVYKSSAGSGKTFTLVKEYLCLVLINPYNFRSVLAITFTNKAADEMKQRVLQTLGLLSDYYALSQENLKKINYLLPELKSKTGLTEKEIAENASLTLSLIIHNYSNFAISTIDSFVYKIVKTFAYDLRLPLNFNVEMDAEMITSKAVDLLIDKMGNDDMLTSFMFDFAKTKVDDDKSWHIETELKNFAKILLNEESQLNIEKISKLNLVDFNKTLKILKEQIVQFESGISNLGKEAVKLISIQNISDESLYQGKKGIAGFFLKISNKNIAFPNETVKKAVSDDKWYSGKATSADKSQIDSVKHQLTNIYQKIIVLLEQDYSNYIIRIAILKNIYATALLNEIEKYIKEIRENENIVHISEFNKRISEIVINEPIPFIYERLGEKFKHFLIDEFQDTSVLQWQNLLPLIDNSLSENYFNMIVGDGKQAIYRFRGGEVEQFSKLPLLYNKTDSILLNERENSLINNFQQEFLSNNFRSKSEIVEFNNSFFCFVSQYLSENLKKIYDNHNQGFNSNNQGGYIQIRFIEGDKEAEYAETTCDLIIKNIAEIQRDAYDWKDITILCRNNKQASKIANYLSANNIDIISSESLLLNSSASVRFIISFLKIISNPNDHVSIAHLVQYINISDDSYHNDKKTDSEQLPLKHFNLNDFEKLMEKSGKCFTFIELMQLPLYELCERIVQIFNLNLSSTSYLQFFLDNVLSYSNKYKSNIKDFLDWWEKKKEKLSVKTPTGINAITIMTIHKSKGLEFPVVIFPFADEKLRKTKDTLWIDVNDAMLEPFTTALINMNKTLTETSFAENYYLEDEKSKLDLINILYVALTRPSERLYVFCKENNKESDILSFTNLFKKFLQSDNKEVNEDGNFTFGKRSLKEKEKEESKNSIINMHSFIVNNWSKKLKISSLSPENWDSKAPDYNRNFGNIIHLILSKAETQNDFEGLVEKFSNLNQSSEEKQKIKNVLSKIAESEELKFLFSNKFKIKNEAEILLKNGNSFRPDKVLFNEEETILIDFKTGKVDYNHRIQLDKYEKSLKDMGYQNISKYLIYVSENPEVLRW